MTWERTNGPKCDGRERGAPGRRGVGDRLDAILDAVQMAVESQGWNLDRFWLPWWPSGRQFADRAELEPVRDPDGKGLLHERKPGLLLFRKPRKEGDLDPRQQVLLV